MNQIFQLDLLQVTGIGQAHGTALPAQPQQPFHGEEPKSSSTSSAGSDILDSSTHELRLDKSNILMLGPTGSGEFLKFKTSH